MRGKPARFCFVPADHWPKLRLTNTLERVNGEISRRNDVVGIALIRAAASVAVDQNDE